MRHEMMWDWNGRGESWWLVVCVPLHTESCLLHHAILNYEGGALDSHFAKDYDHRHANDHCVPYIYRQALKLPTS